ncbi:MAG: hypothetical protein JXR44_00655 [Thiotrichales bacterium]|nr:hypothetical protein [Thiotrichales bacterium]
MALLKKIRKEMNKTLIPLRLSLTVPWRFRHFVRHPKPNPKLPVILTLTSYPKRFPSLHLTLQSLILQTPAAEQILLWIAPEDAVLLPKKVQNLIDQGWVKLCLTEDTRSYKKIIPSLIAYPEATLVTVDDDVYYPPEMLNTLYKMHLKFPNQVIANRTHCVIAGSEGTLAPYREWPKNQQNPHCPQSNFQTGIGGVLYPPAALHSKVTDANEFLQLAPHGDDIWLYWMMRLNGRVALKTENAFTFPSWLGSQKFALYKQNTRQNGNDPQIQAMLKRFGSPLAMPVTPS